MEGKMLREQFGLNRIIYPKIDLENFLIFTRELDLKKIELRNDLPGGMIIDDYSPIEFKDLLNKYGIEIISINALQRFNLKILLSEKISELRQLITLCKKINCKAIVLCPNNDIDDKRNTEEFFKDTISALKTFGPIFQDNDMLGYVEPLGFKECSLRSIITAVKAIQESGFSNYKTVYDSFHHRIGPDTMETIKDNYDISYTGLVHISGVECNLSDDKCDDNHRILVTKHDRFQTKEQLKLLLKMGYRGNISLEPFSRTIQEMEIGNLKSAIDNSIEYLFQSIITG